MIYSAFLTSYYYVHFDNSSKYLNMFSFNICWIFYLLANWFELVYFFCGVQREFSICIVNMNMFSLSEYARVLGGTVFLYILSNIIFSPLSSLLKFSFNVFLQHDFYIPFFQSVFHYQPWSSKMLQRDYFSTNGRGCYLFMDRWLNSSLH